MKKIIIIIISVVLFSISGQSAIIWFTASYLVPSPTTGDAPGPMDGAEDFTVISGTCPLVSTGSVNNLSTSSSATLTLTGTMTFTVTGDVSNVSGCTISVGAGTTLIVNGTINNQGTITIAQGGNLIQTGAGSNSGSGTYNVSATGTGSTTRYNVWSSPLSGLGITSVFGSSNHCDIYHFNGGSQEWVRMTSSSACVPSPPAATGSTSFSAGSGVLIPGGGATTFTGSSINTNISSVSLSSASSGGTWTGDGWNLLGNPYPSTINATDFINANADITGTLYFWADDGSAGAGYDQSADFATRNLGGGTAPSGGGGGGAPTNYIAIGQGFFVQSTSGGSASFPNSIRESGTATFFKSEPENIQRVWLNANKGGNGSSQILIAFTDNATDGEDWGYDSKRMISNPNFIFGSSLEQKTEPFVIQSLNKSVLDNEKEVGITLFTKNEGVVSIEIANTENFDTNVVVYLKDNVTGKLQDLSLGPFSVYLHANQTYNSRFTLVFKNESGPGPTGIKNIDEAYIGVYSYDNILYLNSPKSAMTNLELINMTGSVISNTSFQNTNQTQIDLNHLTPGMYIARIATENNLITSKRFMVK